MKFLPLFLVLTGFCCSRAAADFINGNFEDPPVVFGSLSASIPEWSQSGSDFAGVWNIGPGYGFFDTEAPEGTQIGYSNNAAMAQQSTRVLAEDPVMLFAFAGRRGDTFAASFRMELWVGGTVANGALTGGTLLSSVDFDHTQIAPNSFLAIQTGYTPTANDPLIGQLLSARFVKTTGIQMNFDRIGFEAIPEPSSTMLVLFVGLVAGCSRRQRR